jgi:hypothetical protein
MRTICALSPFWPFPLSFLCSFLFFFSFFLYVFFLSFAFFLSFLYKEKEEPSRDISVACRYNKRLSGVLSLCTFQKEKTKRKDIGRRERTRVRDISVRERSKKRAKGHSKAKTERKTRVCSVSALLGEKRERNTFERREVVVCTSGAYYRT